MEIDKIQLAKFVNMGDPQSVLDEVRTIVLMVFPDFNFKPFKAVSKDTVDLFRGKYPGYQECNTVYHDLKHTTDSLLAMTRLIHGAILMGEPFSRESVGMGLIATLLHDTGYIQAQEDDSGSGAKYTQTHIDRSIEFLDKYYMQRGYSRQDVKDSSDMLRCTGLNVVIEKIRFRSKEIEILGKMLGTADLIGQMADRTYLEKLLFLYYEFQEGNVGDYKNELDLLGKTLGFHTLTKNRLANELGNVTQYMIHHFKERWSLDADMYAITIDRNMTYLKSIMEKHGEKYRDYLRRGGYVKRLEKEGL